MQEKQKVLSPLQMFPVWIHSHTFSRWDDSPQKEDTLSCISWGAQGLRRKPGVQWSAVETRGEGPRNQWQGDKWSKGEKRVYRLGIRAQKTPFSPQLGREKRRGAECVRRWELTAGNSLLSCSCSEDSHQVIYGWLCSAWKGAITWWPCCTKAIFSFKGTSWILIAKTRLKISLETKLCFFCSFPSWELLFSLMIKAGSWGNAETKGRHCLKYPPQKSWKSTFWTLPAQTILVLLRFAKLNCTRFQCQGPKQISYLCVLVRNGNLVYKEQFNLDLVKKIKPVLKHQGKLCFSFEECSNEKGQIHEGDLRTDTKGDPSAWRAMWQLTPIPDMISWTPHLVCYHKALLLSPFIPLKLLPLRKRIWHTLYPLAQYMEEKGAVWPPSPARPPWCSQQMPLPPFPLSQPQSGVHGLWRELVRRCRFRPF